jgi:hypothetical protein
MKKGKSVTGYEKHIVQCTSCGKDILDHMAVCPFCKAPQSASAYTPSDEGKIRKTRLVLTIIFILIIAALFISELVKRQP